MKVRYPPGRAGRLWVMERLAVAERAAAVLGRKEQALRNEQRRLVALAERSARAWDDAVRQAEFWQMRAMIVGDRESLDAAALAAGSATAHVVWRVEMGVEIPAEVRGEVPPAPPIAGSPALAAAASAYRDAVAAGVEHAAVLTAAERVDRELATTRQRLRAVRDRWSPALRDTLRDLELRLDERDREELTRDRLHRPDRRLADRPPPGRPRPGRRPAGHSEEER